jgi:hypothetical protein
MAMDHHVKLARLYASYLSFASGLAFCFFSSRTMLPFVVGFNLLLVASAPQIFQRWSNSFLITKTRQGKALQTRAFWKKKKKKEEIIRLPWRPRAVSGRSAVGLQLLGICEAYTFSNKSQ